MNWFAHFIRFVLPIPSFESFFAYFLCFFALLRYLEWMYLCFIENNKNLQLWIFWFWLSSLYVRLLVFTSY